LRGRARDDDPAEFAWSVSRVCAEFKVSPLVAKRELRRDPDLLNRILELRHYERCFRMVREALKDEQTAKQLEGIPEGADPLLDMAFVLYVTKGQGLS
jgi:hypothetical protein